ncbi:hypothetical protein [Rhizobium leguminosarum]|uniref:hypothetical protein n=1 Tax=Rhizobium leguminosarum TaxID=384 RepID=UPI0021BBFEA5|nr:hypothetical protein [Rhizobium leguminosarum]
MKRTYSQIQIDIDERRKIARWRMAGIARRIDEDRWPEAIYLLLSDDDVRYETR